MQLQTSLALAQRPSSNSAAKVDEHGREPFSHPALEGLANLSPKTKSILTNRSKLAELAQKYDLQKVVRWEPRNVSFALTLRCTLPLFTDHL